MATFRHHIYFVKNLFNKGAASDDARINDRLIAHALKQSRSLLQKRKLDRMESLSDLNFQTFCLDLVPSNFHDCECIPDMYGCQILRSTQEVPPYLISKFRHYVELRYIDGRKISQTSYSNLIFNQYSLGSADTPNWFLFDKHVYVTNTLALKKVLLRAVFEDPEVVILENCQSEGTSSQCDPYSEEFPIDGDLVLPMYQMAMELLGVAYRMPEDTENNAADVKTVQAKQ